VLDYLELLGRGPRGGGGVGGGWGGGGGGGGTEVGVDLDQAVGFGHVGIRRQRGRCLPDWLAKKGSCD